MGEIAALISDMVREGVDPDIIGRTAQLLCDREPVEIYHVEKRAMSNAERQAKYRKNKKLVTKSNESVTDKEKEKVTQKEKETLSPKEKPPTGGKRKGSSPAGRGTRLPPDWVLPEEWGEWAVSEGVVTDRVLLEEEKFRDHWLARAGPHAVKRDWEATWRNWIRRAME